MKLLFVSLVFLIFSQSIQAGSKHHGRHYRHIHRIAAVVKGQDSTENSAQESANDSSKLFSTASQYIGVPYRRGGESYRGFDCSGFTSTVYKKVFGINLERSSSSMAQDDVKDVNRGQLKPGDLVFFSTMGGHRVSHVGIFLGKNRFIHSSTSRGVIISNLNEAYYKRTWVKGGRVKELADKQIQSTPTL